MSQPRRPPERSEKFTGVRFMNPVPVMTMVEVIRGIATDELTFHAIRCRFVRASDPGLACPPGQSDNPGCR